MKNSIKIILLIISVFAFFSSASAIELINTGLSEGVIAPDFKGEDQDGNIIQLSNILKSGTTVLIFYRGDWCMYCNIQLKSYQDNIEEFQMRNVNIIAVSVDKMEKVFSMAFSNLRFNLLT